MKRTALLVLVAGCAAPPAPASRPVHPFGTRSAVYAGRGMVASSHPLASRIGVEILRKGGTAVDAAIAVNAALGFMEPMMCGVGGDLFALVWDAKTSKLHGLNASGRSPRALSADKVLAEPDGTIPPYSPWAWTVPGAVDGWYALHSRFGKLPMGELLAPSIEAAREGVPVPRVISAEWRRAGKSGFSDVFLPVPSEGQVFRNPALAETYEAIARGGRDAFYAGPIAERIVEFSRRQGGFLAPEDFASHRSEWVEPISTDYRGVTVWEIPPNGQGLSVLQMLNVLETLDLKTMGRDSPDFWHAMIEAKKLVFEDRARYYADPAFAKVPVAGLLSKDYARERARLIDPRRASVRPDPGIPASDTTYFCTADAQGNMVSLIQSIYHAGGSGYAVGGFCLQNRGAGFSLNPASPNFLRSGKRPFHTIIPGFATVRGRPWLAFGVMGGDVQPQGHVQVLVNLIDFGMDLQEAGDAPRWRHSGSSEPSGTLMRDGGVVFLEEGVPDSVREELVRRGHRIAPGGWYGGYQAIARDPATGVWAGATESRKDGCALGY
jgi:gamma-glutamyltranspeptidase/glutathione hydrolase